MPDDVAGKLGGPGVGKLLAAPFENQLLASGRFQLLLDRAGRYGVKASITDLKIDSGKTAKKFGFNPFANEAVKKTLGLGNSLEMLNGLADVDWCKAESKIRIECAVAVQLFDVAGGSLLMADTGRVVEENTVKEMTARMGIVDLSKAGPPME